MTKKKFDIDEYNKKRKLYLESEDYPINKYIKYANSIGHKYGLISWDNEIISIFMEKGMNVVKSNKLSLEMYKEIISNPKFQNGYETFKCTNCYTVLVCNEIPNGVYIKIISNKNIFINKIIEFDNKNNPTDINFKLTCEDMIIKKLLE